MTDGPGPEDAHRNREPVGRNDRGIGVDRADTVDDPAAAFARQAQTEYGEAIDRIVAFGDAVRGDRGVHASMEVLVGLASDEDGTDTDGDGNADEGAIDPALEQQLEALGESVGIDHGVVVSVYVLPAERFETQQDHPLLRQALEDGRSYV